MLRGVGATRTLGPADRAWALEVCAEDPVSHVFVAARLVDGALGHSRAAMFAYDRGGERALCWSSANVVPVGGSPAALRALASRVVKRRRFASSVFGPSEQVLRLWSLLSPSWGPAREVRAQQPVLTISRPPSAAGVSVDPLVRVARPDEVDLVAPAAAAMFTEEIGYPPYRGSDAAYRQSVANLLHRGHTLVRIEDGRVVFKADLGSVALGVAQVQGVWVDPLSRGRGIAVPAMAAVVEHTLAHIAPVVTLYVNDFNAAALATYRHVGFEQTGMFTTVLL
jgi:uncharacterized protein